MERIDGLGQRIKMLRRKRGLTQRDLAAQLGLHVADISKLERECAVPTLARAVRLAYALGVSLDALCGWRSRTGEP